MKRNECLQDGFIENQLIYRSSIDETGVYNRNICLIAKPSFSAKLIEV